MMRKFLTVLMAVLALTLPLAAQQSSGTLRGSVTDPQGAIVPGADVAVKNEATNESVSAKTNERGLFLVPYLKPGMYTLEVGASGFQTMQRTGIKLDMGQVAEVSVSLKLGQLSEKVVVTSEAPLLDNVTADRGQVIDSSLISALPLVNRNVYQIVQLTAGVTFNSSFVWMQPYQQNAMERVSIGGGLTAFNESVLDGAPNNVYNQNRILTGSNPPVDAIGEFKIQTNTYDPQNGNTSGGIINMTTKNGTNEFHGAVWDFMKRTPWNATSFQNNAARRSKPTTHIDQYGFEVDGPVYFPKLYDGRGKTFFMASLERYRESVPVASTQSVPEPEMLNGDFSKLTNAAGQRITIYDPMSGYVDGSGKWMRNPFVGNVIPADRINPVTRKIMSYFPKPNQASATSTYSNSNLFLSGGDFGNRDTFYDYILRGDHNLTQSQRIFARYHDSMRHQAQFGNGILKGAGMTGNDSVFSPVSGGLDYVNTLSPTTILNLRGSYSYYHYHQSPMDNVGFDKTSLGFPSSLIGQLPGSPTFGVYTFNGYMNLGQNEFGYRNHNETFEANLSKVVNSHTLKFGADIRNLQYAETPQGCPFCMDFNRDFTRVDYLDTREALTGNSIASALLGFPSGARTENPTLGMFSRKYYAFYAGDDWKVTRKLTVNLGLRYNFYVPFSERYNRVNSGFDTNVTNPADGMIDRTKFPGFPTLKGALLFAGKDGQPRTAVDVYKGGIEPRFGFAYQVNEKTVVRGGFGISHFDTYADMYTKYGFDSVNTTAVASLDSGKTPAPGLITNPFPSGLNSPAPLGPLTYLGRGGLNINLADYKTPYVKQFSIGVQTVLPLNSKIDITYQGSRGMNLRMPTPINEPSLAVRQQCNALEGGNSAYCDANIANPFYQLAPFAGQGRGTSTTQTRWELSRPMPQFGNINNNATNDSKTWYNSLQITYETRSWRGLNARAAYTWSKFIEQYGWADLQRGLPQRGLINASIPESFSAMGTYDLPFGPGKALLTSTNPIVRRITAGWQWNVMWTWNSGYPMDNNSNMISLRNASVGAVDYGANTKLIRVFSPCSVTIPNSAGSPTTLISHGAYDQQFGCSVDTAAWAVKPKYAPDNMVSYRNSAFNKPPLWETDMSLNKMTRITEKVSLQFRAEAANVFNHYSFYGANPSNNATDPLFGLINKDTVGDSNATVPRRIQLGMKVVW